jgi:hypothetical protein
MPEVPGVLSGLLLACPGPARWISYRKTMKEGRYPLPVYKLAHINN